MRERRNGEEHLRYRLLYADEHWRESGEIENGLLTTIACGPTGEVNYALEGAVFMAGASIQWLRDEMKLINDAYDSEYFATKVQTPMVCMWFRPLPGWVRHTGIRMHAGRFSV